MSAGKRKENDIFQLVFLVLFIYLFFELVTFLDNLDKDQVNFSPENRLA